MIVSPLGDTYDEYAGPPPPTRALVYLCLFLFLSCVPLCLAEQSNHGSRGPLLATILSRGELRVGVSPGFIPFVASGPDAEMMHRHVVGGPLKPDPSTGVVGFDIELSRALAASLNVRLRIIKAPGLGALQRLLDDGTIDAALSGITRTLERAWSFYLSEPYFVSGLILLVPDDSPYQTLAELNDPSVTVLVKPDSTSEAFALAHVPNASIEVVADERSFAKRLMKGSCTAVIDAIKARSFVLAGILSGSFRRIERRRFTDEFYGILLPRDESLVRYVNLFLDEYKRSGKFHLLASRFNPWFRSKSLATTSSVLEGQNK